MRDGVNINKQNVIRPLVLPSEIQNLKDLELYLQLPNYPFVKTKIEWKEREVKCAGFIENGSLPIVSKPDATAEQVSIDAMKEETKVNTDKKLKADQNIKDTKLSSINMERFEI